MPSPEKRRTGRPSKLTAVVTTRRRSDGSLEPVTAADAIVERLAIGAYREEAARSVGIARQTLYGWLYAGASARLKQLNGTGKLTAEEQRYAAFLDAVEEAEASALLTDWTRLGQLAAGGIPVTTVREKVERVPDPNNAGQMIERVVERVTTTETTLPDVRALTWRLERRWPRLFSPRVQHTGEDGAPIEVTVTDARQRAQALVDEVRAYQEGVADGSVRPELANPASNGNGKANGRA